MARAEDKRALRMSGEGSGLGIARKNRMILKVLNVDQSV